MWSLSVIYTETARYSRGLKRFGNVNEKHRLTFEVVEYKR